jgi:hypothetical protein
VAFFFNIDRIDDSSDDVFFVEGTASCRGTVTYLVTDGRVLHVRSPSQVDINAVNISCSELGEQTGGNVHLQAENVSCSTSGYLLEDGKLYGSFVDFFAGGPIVSLDGVLDFSTTSLTTGNNCAFELASNSTLRIGTISTGITGFGPVLLCSRTGEFSLDIGRIVATGSSNAYGIKFSGSGQLNANIHTCILPQATLYNTSDNGSIYLSGQLFRKTAPPLDTSSFTASAESAIVVSNGNAPIEINVDTLEISAESSNHAFFFVNGNNKQEARFAGSVTSLRALENTRLGSVIACHLQLSVLTTNALKPDNQELWFFGNLRAGSRFSFGDIFDLNDNSGAVIHFQGDKPLFTIQGGNIRTRRGRALVVGKGRVVATFTRLERIRKGILVESSTSCNVSVQEMVVGTGGDIDAPLVRIDDDGSSDNNNEQSTFFFDTLRCPAQENTSCILVRSGNCKIGGKYAQVQNRLLEVNRDSNTSGFTRVSLDVYRVDALDNGADEVVLISQDNSEELEAKIHIDEIESGPQILRAQNPTVCNVSGTSWTSSEGCPDVQGIAQESTRCFLSLGALDGGNSNVVRFRDLQAQGTVQSIRREGTADSCVDVRRCAFRLHFGTLEELGSDAGSVVRIDESVNFGELASVFSFGTLQVSETDDSPAIRINNNFASSKLEDREYKLKVVGDSLFSGNSRAIEADVKCYEDFIGPSGSSSLVTQIGLITCLRGSDEAVRYVLHAVVNNANDNPSNPQCFQIYHKGNISCKNGATCMVVDVDDRSSQTVKYLSPVGTVTGEFYSTGKALEFEDVGTNDSTILASGNCIFFGSDPSVASNSDITIQNMSTVVYKGKFRVSFTSSSIVADVGGNTYNIQNALPGF